MIESPRGPAVPGDLSDHDLLGLGVRSIVAENAAAAARLACLLELHQRFERSAADDSGRFALTALQRTVVEAGELWGHSPGRVRADLSRAQMLASYFPDVWSLCLGGRLDAYRAGLVADAAKALSDEPETWHRLSESITPWLLARSRHPGGDDRLPELVGCTVKQLRNKLTYETTKLRPRQADERFRRAYDDRHAFARTHPTDGSPGDGMGSLTLLHSLDTVQLADYRLTLAAKAMRAQGDDRPLEQLRTDLAMDLLIGRAQIQSSLGDLERIGDGTAGSDGDRPVKRFPTSGFARPIINVTVPIQTLMSVSDDPGMLSGGTVVPATLARMIAGQPDSTWHRMLTDAVGECVEVSTTSYSPTRTIWNEVVARYSSCFRAGCDRPAADCEIDHKIPFPRGRTAPSNLHPGCERDHRAKHARGFRLETSPHGDVLRTRAGFRHPVEKPPMPGGQSIVPDDVFGFQYTATEIVEALDHLARIQHACLPGPLPWPDREVA